MLKNLIITLAAALTAATAAAQAPADWANFGRFEKENAALAEHPKVVLMGNSITEGWIAKRPDFFAENGYANFGITTHQDLLLYDGEYVRYLEDEGANVHYENDGGALDLYAVRDESGALTGFRAATQEEYDANTKQYMAW